MKVQGYIFSASCISPDSDKVKAVTDFPLPKMLKNLRSFVGLDSSFCRIVRGYGTIAALRTMVLR